jgi:hypothetical protein
MVYVENVSKNQPYSDVIEISASFIGDGSGWTDGSH